MINVLNIVYATYFFLALGIASFISFLGSTIYFSDIRHQIAATLFTATLFAISHLLIIDRSRALGYISQLCHLPIFILLLLPSNFLIF